MVVNDRYWDWYIAVKHISEIIVLISQLLISTAIKTYDLSQTASASVTLPTPRGFRVYVTQELPYLLFLNFFCIFLEMIFCIAFPAPSLFVLSLGSRIPFLPIISIHIRRTGHPTAHQTQIALPLSLAPRATELTPMLKPQKTAHGSLDFI